jgi:hypothetical protein
MRIVERKIFRCDYRVTSDLQLFYCTRDMAGEAISKGGSDLFDIVVQQYICSRLCKPGLFRFYTNGEGTVTSAEHFMSLQSVLTEPYVINQIKQTCEQLQN